MAEETFLNDDFLRQLMSVGEVDLLVAVPTYNNAETIAQTVQAIEASFQQNFVRERSVIVNVDSGSQDDTPTAFLSAPTYRNPIGRGLGSLRTMHRITTGDAGSPMSETAMHSVLAAADLLHAKACAVVSPESLNMTPDWTAALLRPCYREEFDFVAPLYCRPRFDGLLTRNVLYPMGRAAFGFRMRELHSGEFGFSGKLATLSLDSDAWHEEAIRDWPESWMAVTAMASSFRCCQAFLGPRQRSASASSVDIVAAIRQTVGALFWCLESKQNFWMSRNGSEAVPTSGQDHELSDDAAQINRERIFELFRSGVSELEPVLKSILTPDTHAGIQELAGRTAGEFRFSNALWAQATYDFAASYHHAVINRNHLIQAMVPLYRGKIFSFLRQHDHSSPEEMETDSEDLCLEFERQKPYLVERWNAKE